MACVLVIDDDVSILYAFEKAFTQFGLSVDTANSGEAGITTFKENCSKYSAVFLDLMMPNIDGFQVLREIRKISDVMVYLVTGAFRMYDHRFSKLREEGLSFIAMEKPVTYAKLKLLAEVLQGKKEATCIPPENTL